MSHPELQGFRRWVLATLDAQGLYSQFGPSENLVMIRMGDVPDNSLVPFTFQNDLWKKFRAVID